MSCFVFVRQNKPLVPFTNHIVPLTGHLCVTTSHMLCERSDSSFNMSDMVGTLVLVSQSSVINVNHLADGQYLVAAGNSIIKLIKK